MKGTNFSSKDQRRIPFELLYDSLKIFLCMNDEREGIIPTFKKIPGYRKPVVV